MKKLLLLLIPVFIFSCKKSEDNSFVLNFQSILNKYMVCDSIKTTTGNVTVTRKLGKGKGFDLKFLEDATFITYSTPEVKQSFQLAPPDKMYYYKEETDPERYFIVPSVSSSKLVLQNTDSTGASYTRYFTAE